MTAPSSSSQSGPWWLGRLVAIILLAIGVGLLVQHVSRGPDSGGTPVTATTSNGNSSGLRGAAASLLGSVYGLLRLPLDGVGQGFATVQSYFFVHERNAELARQVALQRPLVERVNHLAQENKHLKALLGLTDIPVRRVGGARIVGASSASYVRSALIARGAQGGVAVGQPVRDVNGLVGRVVEVGRYAARVLLLTDVNAMTPVKVARTGQTAMVAGVNEPLLRVRFLSEGTALRVGDKLVSSGDGGVYPPGIPVAVITRLGGEGEPTARPLANPDGLDFVVVLEPYPPHSLVTGAMASAPMQPLTAPPEAAPVERRDP